MQYPTLFTRQRTQEGQDVFGGYNHNIRTNEGEFYDMRNLSSDHYPVLCPRKPRGLYAENVDVQGLIAKDSLCYVDGADFVINGYHIDMGLSTNEEDCPKQLVSMGAYVIIMPDKKWINTMDLTDYGDIDASYESAGDVTITLCDMDGGEYTGMISGPAAPTAPDNMQLWLDTSGTPHVLKQYSADTDMWVSLNTTYVKIHCPNLGKSFSQYDGVNIAGIQGEDLQDLNGSHIVYARGDDYIVVVGILDVEVIQEEADGKITISRKMPLMDFVIESGNRLWGCRYGLDEYGEVVNRIYASKQGDFKNWNCYMGISTDSYFANCGTDGPFTGAITHAGHPLFWKENYLHDVYGQIPSNFRVQDTACRGVQKGCSRSLAIVNEILYYKARHAVCAYDGSLPQEVSAAFGEERYGNAVAAAHGNKYYISMEKTDGTGHVFMVLDIAKGLWHKEDDLQAYLMCSCRDELYCSTGDGKIITMLGSADTYEEQVEWMAESGIIGARFPNRKYLSKLNIRMVLEMGSELTILAQYDSVGPWESLGTVFGTDLHSFTIPVRPQRCDHLRIRFEGRGEGMIFSITKTLAHGSDAG